jgi:Ca2+-binding RTX toxin-like protein
VLSHVGTVPGANGLSIYLPLSDIDASYATLSYSFLRGTGWGNFLRFMLDDRGDDVLTGDGTNNDIRGFAGHDSLAGYAGRDTLYGGLGHDTLAGGAGADRLLGQSGADVIRGGLGADTLVGGAGQDTLTGGAGSDVFDFNNLAEAGLAGDLITDFVGGEDRIDLATLDADAGLAGNQAFSFIGTVAFTPGDAAGELRFDAAAHILYGSTNADSAAEFAIRLGTLASLAAADLVL